MNFKKPKKIFIVDDDSMLTFFMYKKSLELNPASEGGKKALEELQKK